MLNKIWGKKFFQKISCKKSYLWEIFCKILSLFLQFLFSYSVFPKTNTISCEVYWFPQHREMPCASQQHIVARNLFSKLMSQSSSVFQPLYKIRIHPSGLGSGVLLWKNMYLLLERCRKSNNVWLGALMQSDCLYSSLFFEHYNRILLYDWVLGR